MKKAYLIFLNAIPVLIMIGLISLVLDDYLLTAIYLIIIAIALFVRRTKNDILMLVFGFFIMIVFEYLFISTSVETFNRNSLFGLMPLWLPFLWAYSFVAMKRAIEILNN